MKANFASLLATLLCMSFSVLAAPTSEPQYLTIPLKMQTGISRDRSLSRYGSSLQARKDTGVTVPTLGIGPCISPDLRIGSQFISFILDTGSSQLNVDAEMYTPGPSAINTNQTVKVQFTNGQFNAGIYLDTVQLDSTNTYNVPIYHDSVNRFNNGPFTVSGTFGLSFPDKTGVQSNLPTFLEQYFNQHPSQPQQFATWVGRFLNVDYDSGLNFTEATFYIGGYDSAQFYGSLTYTDVVPSNGLWEIPSGVQINDQAVSGFLDSGTTTIMAPSLDILENFANNLNLTVLQGPAFATIPVPCSADEITVSFNNLTREIPHVKDHKGNCTLPVTSYNSINVTAGGNWVFGMPIYQRFFIVHDIDNKRAGFAFPKYELPNE